MPKTWEEAAHEAAREIFEYPWAANDLDEVDRLLDMVRQGELKMIGSYALIQAGDGTGDWPTMQRVIDTVIAKQHDYGHQNILRHGLSGIVVRMCDKVERIRNLQKRLTAHKFSGQGEPAELALNEPLADSWGDLVGYSIIGIMLLDGTFELPLEADLAPTNQYISSYDFVPRLVSVTLGDGREAIYQLEHIEEAE